MKSPNHFHDQSTYRFWLSADFPDCLPVYDGNDTRFISSSERKLFTCYSNNIAYFWFFGNVERSILCMICYSFESKGGCLLSSIIRTYRVKRSKGTAVKKYPLIQADISVVRGRDGHWSSGGGVGKTPNASQRLKWLENFSKR